MANMPDGWILTSGDQSADIEQESSTTNSGLYALKFPNSSPASDVVIKSEYIDVGADIIFKVDGIVQADNASGQFKIEAQMFSTIGGSVVRTVAVTGGLVSVSTINTWERFSFYLTAGSTERYIRIVFTKDNGTNFNLYLDRVEVNKAMGFFHMFYNGTTQTHTGAGWAGGLSMDNFRCHNCLTGTDANPTGVARVPRGIWVFGGRLRLENVASGDYAIAGIAVNGTVAGSGWSGAQTYSGGSTQDLGLVVNTGPVVVTSGSTTYELDVYSSDTSSRNLTNGNDDFYFYGYQLAYLDNFTTI